MDAQALARVAAHNRLAVERADRPVVTLCTGRPQPFAEAVCRLISNTSLPCVAENGVWLYDPRTNGYERDPRILPEHLAAVREASRWAELELGPLGVSQQPGKHASVSLYHPDAAYLRTLEPRVAREFAERRWPFRVSMTWLYINCDLSHVSKATGLDRWFAATGLDAGRVAGIGDTPGDAAIADRVAWFACPANAHALIRPRAAYVSPHAEVHGVLDILSRV